MATTMGIRDDRPIAMLVPLPRTGDPAVDALVMDGTLTPASNPGGVAALLAITPVPAEDGQDSTEVISELREDRGWNYLDSRALVKLARREPESDALRAWLRANPDPLVSSALARSEALRALLRVGATNAVPVMHRVLSTVNFLPITDAVLDAAARLPGPWLRTLDAIHLATAGTPGSVLGHVVSYDKRLAEAVRSQGIPVTVPT